MQKAELKVVGVFEVRTWSVKGISVLVCTRGAAIEMDWWWFGVFLWILQYYTHFSPRLHALHVLTWYTRRGDVTTSVMVKAILCLKTLVFIPS